jgi:hypothetical protein
VICEIERNTLSRQRDQRHFLTDPAYWPLSRRPVIATTLLAVLRWSCLLPALVLAVASRTGAQAVAQAATYVRENWTVADGLPILRRGSRVPPHNAGSTRLS